MTIHWQDNVGMSVSGTPGSGTITLGSALAARAALAGHADGQTLYYYVKDGTAWETGTGTIGGSGTTLARSLSASSTGSLLALSSSAEVYLDLTAAAARRAADVAVNLEPGTGLAARLQALNDELRNNGGGNIVLRPGALYELDDVVTIDAGTGVGLIGNGAWIDGTAVTSGSLVTLSSRSPSSALPSGLDGSSDNYHHYRTQLGGFVLMVGTGADGIDINLATGVGTRNVRALISGCVIKGGRYGIRHRNYAYLCHIDRTSIYGQTGACVSIEGGLDKGELSTISRSALFNAVTAVRVDTVPETGTARGVDVVFDCCAFDYLTSKMLEHVSGYGKFHFRGCHSEFSHSGSGYWMDLATAASNRTLWQFEGCDWTHTGATQNFPALWAVGSNHDVRVLSPHFHDVLGAGVSSKTMLANVTGTGQWHCEGTHSLSNPQLPRHASNYGNANWLADGGFDQSAFVDHWYINAGDFSSLTRAASGGNLTAGCLQVSMASGAAARTLGLVIPRRGRFVSVSMMAKLTGGSGTLALKIGASVVRPGTAPGTKPTFEYDPASTQIDTKTLSTSAWTEIGLTSASPRYEIPEWATHLKIIVDGASLSAAASNLLLDEVRVDQW